jgi:hypothetical protein
VIINKEEKDKCDGEKLCRSWNEALQAIEEASTGTVADDVNQLRAQSSRFAQLDDDQKGNIVMETESAATKRQTKYGVKIFRRRCQI